MIESSRRSYEIKTTAAHATCLYRASSEESARIIDNCGRPECLTILMAEDSILQQSLHSILLRRLGHTVTVVGDGFEAVSSVQVHDFDVILMDCQMPLMNGMDATRYIRKIFATSKRKREPIIIGVTANCSSEECFDAGMDYFLRKPLKLPILEAVLGRLKRDSLQTRLELESNIQLFRSSD